jgi:hypothetical protein
MTEVPMRSFRFPRFTIFLMIACFLTITGAIGLAAEISRRVELPYNAGSRTVIAILWQRLPAMLATGIAVFCCFGAIGYGVRVIFGRTGLQRLSNLDIRSSQQHPR